MTTLSAGTVTGSSFRSAGWAAIASGLVGIVTFGILQVAVFSMVKMLSSPSQTELLGFVEAMFSAHLVGIILQFLLMIPVAFGLHALARRRFPDLSQVAVTLGVMSLSLTILCASLHFVRVVADSFYMIPQGVVGVWIMIVSRQLSSPGCRALARFGMVVGFGLVLVGTFPLGYGIFVDSSILRAPVPYDSPDIESVANEIVHNILLIGTALGVLTLPFWSILLGRRLLRA